MNLQSYVRIYMKIINNWKYDSPTKHITFLLVILFFLILVGGPHWDDQREPVKQVGETRWTVVEETGPSPTGRNLLLQNKTQLDGRRCELKIKQKVRLTRS